jgi:hypothetical protein
MVKAHRGSRDSSWRKNPPLDEPSGEHTVFIGINPILALVAFSLSPEDALTACEDNDDVLSIIWGLLLIVLPHFLGSLR